MYKILIVDRCFFSRSGLKIWLRQTVFAAEEIIVVEADSLPLAAEVISLWRPQLIIADFSNFMATLNHSLPRMGFDDMHADYAQVILLQSNHHSHTGNVSKHHSNICILDKSVSLTALQDIVRNNLAFASTTDNQKAYSTALLTEREARILTLWREEAHNSLIAKLMGISTKTVYTYKRNIRVKLGANNRLSLFRSLA